MSERTSRRTRQRIRYLRTADGVRIAWAESGLGLPVVKASNWLTHLERDLDSPVWSHWIRFFSSGFRFVRFDERGCGLSDWSVADVSSARWVGDLEAVVRAAKPKVPFVLLGISQGAASAAAFAARHPSLVSHLVLYGGYARGWALRGDPDGERRYRAIVDLARLDWGSENPVFRRLFAARFLPGGSEDQIAWFTELCRETTHPETAARLLEARAEVDVSGVLKRVRAKTLVLHARNDEVVPIASGRDLALGIESAEFVELDSRNHVLLEHEPAWDRFRVSVLDFLGVAAPLRDEPLFDRLTAREREILGLVAAGLGNAEIAEKIFLSEKTVRNHLTHLFEKLGVKNRSQAIVLARDRGFGG